MTNEMTFNQLGRRDQKRARTTVALLEALAAALATRTLDEIPISELATAANVSEPTFYNYFASKAELLTYFVRAWGIRMGALAHETIQAHGRSLDAIEELFASTARETAAAPNVMLEIIAAQARGFEPPDAPIETAVRWLLVPGECDVETLSEDGLAGVVPPLLRAAIADGELPASTSFDQVWLAVASTFFGVPLLVGRQNPAAIEPLYTSQLRLIWAGCHNQESS